MTDYLEALLPEEREEEEELSGASPLGRTGRVLPPEREGAPGETVSGEDRAEDNGLLSRQPSPLETAQRFAAARREGEDVPQAQGQTPGEELPPWAGPGLQLAAELASAARSVRRAAGMPAPAGSGAGAEALLGSLEQARQAVRAVNLRTAASGGGSLSLPEEGGAAPGLSLAELDRAVQRDARRYDGGFTLY